MTEYNAILIDTSIYDKYGLKLESGLLAKLKQFSDSEIDFLIPDVVMKEVCGHIIKKTREVRESLEKSLKNGHYYLSLSEEGLGLVKETLKESEDVESFVLFRFEKFMKDTNALSLCSSDYVEVSDVMDLYFTGQPPFSKTGNKKSEFPDAILLSTVNNWAIDEDKKVLAVSSDKDWKEYCNSSENIDYIENFSDALNIFNSITAPFTLIENLSKAIKEGHAQELISKVNQYLESEFDGFIPEVEADSFFSWEESHSEVFYKGFDFLYTDFNVVEKEEDYVVIESTINIKLEAEGYFSLYIRDSIDKDYVSVGSSTVKKDIEFQSEVLITLSGTIDGDVNEINVDEVELIDGIGSIDFGTLELNYDEHE